MVRERFGKQFVLLNDFFSYQEPGLSMFPQYHQVSHVPDGPSTGVYATISSALEAM